MRLKNQSSWLLAGMAAMIVLTVSERRAVAASVSTGTGLTITGEKATPIGDPQYEYSFDITVTASLADPFTSGSSVVITGLNGISPANPLTAAGTSEPGWLASFGVGTATFVYYTPPPAPANPSITMDTTFTSGAFYVGLATTDDPATSISYTSYDAGGNMLTSGTVTVTLVPEPSSAVLILAGAGAISLGWLGNRYRARSKAVI